MISVHPIICTIIVLLFSRDESGEIKSASPFIAFLICFLGGFIFFVSVLMRDGFGLGIVGSEGEEALWKSLPGIIIGAIISILPYCFLMIDYLKKGSSKRNKQEYNTEDILDSGE